MNIFSYMGRAGKVVLAASLVASAVTTAAAAKETSHGRKVARPTKKAASHKKAAPAAKSPWLTADPRTHTVHILLIANDGNAGGGFNFDGYTKGGLVFYVPRNWVVDVTLKNDSSTLPHSAMVVVPPKGSTFPQTLKPAFPGAESAHPETGILKGTVQQFHFRPTRVGMFDIVCAVPGHADGGMWVKLDVTNGGTPHVGK